jgi:hypothetical protein
MPPAVAGLVVTGTSAVAQPIDKGHFHDVFTDDPYSCDGLPAQDSGDISGNFLLNQRGSSPFPSRCRRRTRCFRDP